MQDYDIDTFLENTDELYDSGSEDHKSALDSVHELLLLQKRIAEASALSDAYMQKAVLLSISGNEGVALSYANVGKQEREKIIQYSHQLEQKEASLETMLIGLGVPKKDAFEGAMDYKKGTEFIRTYGCNIG
jgi:hypothetical protein